MSKRNDDFFKEKKIWSTVKDNLLGCYLRPYFSKIFFTNRPVIYVDCFAGKGKFDDGSDGSPIIALDIIQSAISNSNAKNPRVEANFIDLNYATDLKTNLAHYNGINIISGKYEDEIDNLLKSKSFYNVFLYIDPYGIKALDCTKFDFFAKRFNSIELLINLNSFGFIREACHAMGASFEDSEIFNDLIEYDTSKFDASTKSINDLNVIAGGDYWQQIIIDYKTDRINGYEAEERFANEYSKRLASSYKYVLNMPLRLKEGQQPKYRMIHATNHQDGCILMADNICKRWEAMREIQTSGQLSFFEPNYNNQYNSQQEIENIIESHYQQYINNVSLNESMADFFTANGAICTTKEISEYLKMLEKKNKLIISRVPSLTSGGKKSTFMTEGHGKKVLLRWSK